MDSSVFMGSALIRRIRGAFAAFVCGCVLFTAFSLAPQLSAAAERDGGLAASGIRFPEGFDRNTIGEVRGRVAALTKPEDGPVRFRLDSEYDSYIVLTAPAWYWKEVGARVRNGDGVVVKGSKTVGRDGGLYLVAQWLKEPAENATYRFRDKTGRALWTEREGGEGVKRDIPSDSRNSLDDSGKGGGWGSLLDSLKGARSLKPGK